MREVFSGRDVRREYQLIGDWIVGFERVDSFHIYAMEMCVLCREYS